MLSNKKDHFKHKDPHSIQLYSTKMRNPGSPVTPPTSCELKNQSNPKACAKFKMMPKQHKNKDKFIFDRFSPPLQKPTTKEINPGKKITQVLALFEYNAIKFNS